MKVNQIIHGLALPLSQQLENKSIDCIITSPPYWQLRDYGFFEQWGLEPTYQEYLEHLWSLFDVLKDKLKDTGTVWINLGDSYNTTPCGYVPKEKASVGNQKNDEIIRQQQNRIQSKSFASKCLMLIPHRFAIGMIERGWILRNDIIWAKRNGMPESVTDRFSKKHEFMFLFVKQSKYYFDLDSIREKIKPESITRDLAGYRESPMKGRYQIAHEKRNGTNERNGFLNPNGKNPGDVADFWDINTKPGTTKHYAKYNTKLIDKPIIAGCPKGGTILDPFAGTGKTLERAIELERNAIGFDGKKEYVDEANNKLRKYHERIGLNFI